QLELMDHQAEVDAVFLRLIELAAGRSIADSLFESANLLRRPCAKFVHAFSLPLMRYRLAAEKGGVLLGVVSPLLRQIVQSEDRRNRAHRHAGAAIDAFHRIDV